MTDKKVAITWCRPAIAFFFPDAQKPDTQKKATAAAPIR